MPYMFELYLHKPPPHSYLAYTSPIYIMCSYEYNCSIALPTFGIY